MMIEVTLRSGKKAVLYSESMTFHADGKVYPVIYWPIKTDENGEQWCDNSQVISWREVSNESVPERVYKQNSISEHKAEQPAVLPKLSVLPCPGLSDQGRASGEDKLPQPGTETVRVPSEPQVPSGGNLL